MRRLPRYVPVPTNIIFASGEESLLGYYARLRALAWIHHFEYVEEMPISQLCAYLNIKRRQLYNLLKRMHQLEWLDHETRSGRIRINFRPTMDADWGLQINQPSPDHDLPLVQLIALNMLVKLNMKNDDDSSILTNKTSAKNCTEPEILTPGAMAFKALIDRKVNSTLAETLATDNPPVLILEYCERYDFAVSVDAAANPGYLIASIRNRWDPIKNYVPPGIRCPECAGLKWRHAKNCPVKFTAPEFGMQFLEEYGFFPEEHFFCPTCGIFTDPDNLFEPDEIEPHSVDCWRGILSRPIKSNSDHNRRQPTNEHL